MPKFKNQSTLQRIFLGKHDRSLGFADIDIPMLFISTFLLFFGIVMVTSVSLPLTSGSLNMTLSHIQKIFIAFVFALFAFRMPMSFWQKNSIYFLLFSLLLLILVFVPFIGKEVNGAFRWIRVLGFSFQPSELMKFSLIIYISSYCIRKYDEFREEWLGFFKPVFLISLSILLILLEPDLGSSAVIFIVSFSILFIAGAPLKHLMSIFIVANISLDERIKLYLGFGKRSGQRVYPETSLETMPFNKETSGKILSWMVGRFANKLPGFLRKRVRRVLKKNISTI